MSTGTAGMVALDGLQERARAFSKQKLADVSTDEEQTDLMVGAVFASSCCLTSLLLTNCRCLRKKQGAASVSSTQVRRQPHVDHYALQRRAVPREGRH
jgi:hypothetical protein